MVDHLHRCLSCHAPLPVDASGCPTCGTDAGSRLPTQTSAFRDSAETIEARTIGEFKLIRVIGRGGMGTVYEAHQESMRRTVALKVLTAAVVPTNEAVVRFEREAWIAGRLSHPNIVRVYSQGAEGASHYLAMELVDGPSLHQVIRTMKAAHSAANRTDSSAIKRHIRRMVELFVGVADALQHVHAHRVVHRDIKPLNLLLTKQGDRLLLTDFGVAREEDASGMTRRGEFIGTVRYMSPEQLLAQRAKVDSRSDIWSLGISLYEAVTLDFPFRAATEEGYISAIATKDPAPARSRNRAVQRDLETVLIRCLERDPERRYGSAAELKADLVRLLEGQPVAAQRPGLFLKARRLARRHRGVLGVSAVVFATSVVGSWLLINRDEAKREVERTQAGSQADLDRIRSALETSIESAVEPASLASDWKSMLLRIRHEARRDPRGQLALLARRAAVRMTVSVPAFGLLSDPPPVYIGRDEIFSPGIPTECAVGLEASWDDGEWQPAFNGIGFSDLFHVAHTTLDRSYGDHRVGPGPHRLQVRARFSFLDLADAANRRTGVSERVIFTEIRGLGSFSISLFETYPVD